MVVSSIRVGIALVLAWWAAGSWAQQVTTSKFETIIGVGFTQSGNITLRGGRPWVTVGSFAGGCDETDTSKCLLGTACRSGSSVIYSGGSTEVCTKNTKCFVLTMLESPPNVGPMAFNYGCRMGWPNTAYRTWDVITTPSTPGPSDAPSIGRSLISSVLSAPTSEPPISDGDLIDNAPRTSPSPLPTNSSNSQDGSGSGGGSKAWIAGAVVGPIVGIALVGAGVWFLLRRRKRGSEEMHEMGNSETGRFEKFGYSRDVKDGGGETRPAELAETTAPVELPAGRI